MKNVEKTKRTKSSAGVGDANLLEDEMLEKVFAVATEHEEEELLLLLILLLRHGGCAGIVPGDLTGDGAGSVAPGEREGRGCEGGRDDDGVDVRSLGKDGRVAPQQALRAAVPAEHDRERVRAPRRATRLCHRDRGAERHPFCSTLWLCVFVVFVSCPLPLASFAKKHFLSCSPSVVFFQWLFLKLKE